eukprot:COSAG05_NODE_202_length_14312_cov_7.897629_4_plen_185_part_00
MPQACLIALVLYDSCWLFNVAIRTTGPDVQAQAQFQPNWELVKSLATSHFCASQRLCHCWKASVIFTVCGCLGRARNGSYLRSRLPIGLGSPQQGPFRAGPRAFKGQRQSMGRMSQSMVTKNSGSWDHINRLRRNRSVFPSHVTSSAKLLGYSNLTLLRCAMGCLLLSTPPTRTSLCGGSSQRL